MTVKPRTIQSLELISPDWQDFIHEAVDKVIDEHLKFHKRETRKPEDPDVYGKTWDAFFDERNQGAIDALKKLKGEKP